MFKIKELVIGINIIKDFIKHSAKKLPDKNNRGFVDHIDYMQEILDRILDLFKYYDNIWQNSKR